MLLLPGGHEAVVALGVIGTDALGDDQLICLLGKADKLARHSGLNVLHIGSPGERAEGGLALGLGLAVCLGLGATLLAGGAALLAHGGGQALIQAQLLRKGQALKEGHNLVSGGHLRRVKRLLLLVGGLTLGWVWPVNFYWGLKMPAKTSRRLVL